MGNSQAIQDVEAPTTGIYPRTFEEARQRHARHFARYLFARPYAVGARVIDAACGSGYGSAYLAEVATSVLGLDVDTERIDWSVKFYTADNITYRLHDLHQPLSLDEPVQLVTSFETLEHVDDPAVCLKNLADALADDGTALISVPNGTMELEGGGPKPYHVRQFSAEDFEQLLRGRFGEVEIYGQIYVKSLSHYVSKWFRGQKRQAANYRFAPGRLAEAKTWLACCRKPIR